MAKNRKKILEKIITFLPLPGILVASFLKLSALEHQLLMLCLLVWTNTFFLYSSWESE